jgi:hypothetical protein
MLNGIKRKALVDLVGQDTADQLMQAMSQTEKSARLTGTAYKDFDDADVDDLANALLANPRLRYAITEKCSPGTMDGNPRYPSAKKAKPGMDMKVEDDEEDDEEDDGEDMGPESLLTEDEMVMIADAVAERLMGRMDEMKEMMNGLDSELKMRGYMRKSHGDDTELVSTLKDYTDSQETFAEAMVDALEDISTRMKAMEESVGVGYSGSNALNNIIGGSSHKSFTNQYIKSPEEQAAYDFWYRSQQ